MCNQTLSVSGLLEKRSGIAGNNCCMPFANDNN
jgi:hypothetical protein